MPAAKKAAADNIATWKKEHSGHEESQTFGSTRSYLDHMMTADVNHRPDGTVEALKRAGNDLHNLDKGAGELRPDGASGAAMDKSAVKIGEAADKWAALLRNPAKIVVLQPSSS